MKKWIKFAGILVLTLPVMALATGYPSTNVTINIPSNQLVFASYAYDSTNNTVDGLFKGLPMGSHIYLWNRSTQSWVDFIRARTGFLPTSTSNRLIRGVGAFIMSPTATNVIFSGDISSNASTAISKANGFSLLGYPYPVDMAFTNTQIAKTAANGEKILIWTNNSWVVYSKLRTGWVPSATNLVLKNCGAFVYFAYTNSVVNEIRPYEF